MLIPNILITFTGTNASGGSRAAPAYVADLIRATWGKRLASLETQPIPMNAPDAYREVGSVAEEETIWRTEFRAVFATVYPNGLRAAIEKLLEADADAREVAARRLATPVEAHASFTSVGCTVEQALALQRAGFATLADLPDSFLTVAEVPGIAPDFARRLIAAKAEDAKPKTRRLRGASPLEAEPTPVPA